MVSGVHPLKMLGLNSVISCNAKQGKQRLAHFIKTGMGSWIFCDYFERGNVENGWLFHTFFSLKKLRFFQIRTSVLYSIYIPILYNKYDKTQICDIYYCDNLSAIWCKSSQDITFVFYMIASLYYFFSQNTPISCHWFYLNKFMFLILLSEASLTNW